ncbi:c-type cytochrome [Vineibacter terrae]|uniref:c-type cytochrome n=1 Tax=Vineibacter terrae TaxID=2586908 RepID=UPI002E374191|nr:c-type cytochrome [Vineibacter terrae]HEX2885513.1 c-type cytochrome [Vineibacter terrae]
MDTLLACAIVAVCIGPQLAAVDADRGKALWEAKCIGCHALDANRVGPLHRGVFGRKAGAAPGFTYSAAVRNAGFVWDEARLEKWLAGPAQFLPGSRMGFSVADPADRADIIAYLKSLSGG